MDQQFELGVDWNKWEVTVSDPGVTGLRLYKVRNPENGVEVTFAEFNQGFDVHSATAWAGARTSRTDSLYEDIFAELNAASQEGRAISGKKLATFFGKYGHASVAGMSPVFLYINKIPIHLPFWIFNHISVGDGQELSTRFFRMSDLEIAPIESLVDLSKLDEWESSLVIEGWEFLLNYLVEKYNKWYPIVREALESQFNSNWEEPIKESTVNARTLDIVRMWIPAGASTSMALLNSVRVWIDLVSQLREHSDPEAHQLAEQIVAALSLKDHPSHSDVQADLVGLMKYGYARNTIANNLQELKVSLENYEGFQELLAQTSDWNDVVGLRAKESWVGRVESCDFGILMLMQYILVLYPRLDEMQVLVWLGERSEDELAKLGETVLQGHNHHDLTRNMGDVRGTLFIIQTALAYARDLNRHRAWGRFVPMLETKDFGSILQMGWNDNIQMKDTIRLQGLRDEWNADMKKYYEMLLNYYNMVKKMLPDAGETFMLRILPLGHQVTMHMSSSITQMMYMISQRSAGGGDEGYKYLMHQMLQRVRGMSPVLRNVLPHVGKPDVNDRVRFRDRS